MLRFFLSSPPSSFGERELWGSAALGAREEHLKASAQHSGSKVRIHRRWRRRRRRKEEGRRAWSGFALDASSPSLCSRTASNKNDKRRSFLFPRPPARQVACLVGLFISLSYFVENCGSWRKSSRRIIYGNLRVVWFLSKKKLTCKIGRSTQSISFFCISLRLLLEKPLPLQDEWNPGDQALNKVLLKSFVIVQFPGVCSLSVCQ